MLFKTLGSFMSPSTSTLKSIVPLISLSIKSMLSLISEPCLKKLATFTSTFTLNNPAMPKTTIKIPEIKTVLGDLTTSSLNFSIILSNILESVIALDFRSQSFNFIKAGNVKELSNHAQTIPTEILIPYPTRGSSGDVLKVKKAPTVVILVKKIGVRRASMLEAMALSTFLSFLISRKNLVITCTPSEFAMVSNIIGMEVLNNANKNLSDPVNLNAHPINPIMANKEKTITTNTIPTAGMLRRFINRTDIIISKPVLTND